jgi:hypothetical protein
MFIGYAGEGQLALQPAFVAPTENANGLALADLPPQLMIEDAHPYPLTYVQNLYIYRIRRILNLVHVSLLSTMD